MARSEVLALDSAEEDIKDAEAEATGDDGALGRLGMEDIGDEGAAVKGA